MYKQGILGGKPGSFDTQGNPTTIIFTYDDCPPCENAMEFLDYRDISYEEILISPDDSRWKEFISYRGGTHVPKIVSGSSVTIGDNKKTIVSGLAEAYGTEVLMQKEADAMMGHFDEDGNPLVVLYGTDRCGYVKKAREYLNAQGVEFVDLNIDRSAEASANFIALEGSGTPLIYFGYCRIEGWSKPEIDRAIKELL